MLGPHAFGLHQCDFNVNDTAHRISTLCINLSVRQHVAFEMTPASNDVVGPKRKLIMTHSVLDRLFE